jgi:hypothetical protein
LPTHSRASRGSPGGLGGKAHPELPLSSLAFGNASRTLHDHTARAAGLALYYQCRDCAALPSRPPGSQRQGDQRGETHLEPLLCPRSKEGLPSFAPRPRKMAGSLPTLSNDATMQICRGDCPASPQPSPAGRDTDPWSLRHGATVQPCRLVRLWRACPPLAGPTGPAQVPGAYLYMVNPGRGAFQLLGQHAPFVA